ncbi:glycosyltransferase family 1 protein [Calocera cornea HHB12733]|uniref:Glycosyltransferase family 1 protein n=1 Tax=Calocera cornea HHB12733 TaxID=1353952 RepID=A0A165FF96_9BASI|nr:glycosyltransferase family 1 protein [Calocera cornea HHB12733]
MGRHIVLLSFVAWGHMRPECNLAANLLRKFPDLKISFFADADFQTKAKDEIDRIISEGDDSKLLLSRIRVIAAGHALAGIGSQLGPDGPTLDPRLNRTPMPECSLEVVNVFEKLMTGAAFTDDNGLTWEAIPEPPSLVIADLFMGDAVVPLKKKYGLRTYMYWIATAASFTRWYGTVAHGGIAEGYIDFCHATEADPTRANGRSYAQIAKEMYAHSGRYPDDIVRVKGLPPCYEWEDYPQESWLPGVYSDISVGYPLVLASDGVIIPTLLELEPEAVDDVKDWYGEGTTREVFCLGPQLPAAFLDAPTSSPADPSTISVNEVQISYVKTDSSLLTALDPAIAFLNAALAKYGPKSALYISFGSLFVPTPAHLQYFFECLLELETTMPFVFAATSPLLALPEELRKKIEESGRGIIVPWAPQQTVLMHPATGWIASHCGAGGTFESLSQGIPLIAWPISSDQPQNARWLSEVVDTAFELLQVRVGMGQKLAYRNGGTEIVGTEEAIKKEMMQVLNACGSEEGENKRANAQRIKTIIAKGRSPGGQVEQHMKLLDGVLV